MNQTYQTLNAKSSSRNHQTSKNVYFDIGHRVLGKVNWSQTYLFKENLHNEILNHLSPAELKNLFEAMELVYLEKHEYLYQPEDLVRFLYFPESAVISEFQILDDGKTVEIAMTGCEGIVGMPSIFNGQRSTHWSQVLVPGKALRINYEFFKQRADCCPDLHQSLFETLSHYLSQISQRVICNNHHTVVERLCFWLLMIHERCEKSHLPLTQEQIARSLGVHRPSITLVTQSLREQGVIDYVRGKVSILNKPKLRELACICYSTVKHEHH